MGLFSRRHEGNIASHFQEIFDNGTNLSETEFLDSLNVIVREVEVNDSYSTNQKLKIYELLSQITNCFPEERNKYAKKLVRVLK